MNYFNVTWHSMRHLLLFWAITFNVVAVAQETIREGRKLHPNATLLYCKKKVYDKNTIPPMSPIERVAIESSARKIYIKFYEQDGELETLVSGKTNTIGDWNYFPVIIGGIGINFEEEKLAYLDTNNKVVEVFNIDIKKSADAMRLEE